MLAQIRVQRPRSVCNAGALDEITANLRVFVWIAKHLEGLCLWLGYPELRSRYIIPTRRILTVDVNKKDCDSVSLDGSLWASQLFKCAQTRLQTAADSPADCCRTSARPFIAAGRSHLDKGECVTPSPLARPCPALAGHRMPPPGHLVLCPAWRARWRRGR